jgi:lipopolysaccharide export system permease protein
MRAFFPSTLSWYLVRLYLFNFIMLLCGLLGIIYLFDTVELLRRAAKVENITLLMTLEMGIFKLPEVGQLVFPFAILFSAMLTFWQLTRRHELVIVRSAGLSVWQFLIPIILVSFVIGIVNVGAINPIGTLFLNKYKNLETEYLDKKTSLITLSEQGLWLRQKNEEGTVIVHSEKIDIPTWTLQNTIVFFFSPENDFKKRIDATSAKLEAGKWNFNNAYMNQPQTIPEKTDLLTLSTDLTTNELEESFSDPETISFWKLPAYIKVLRSTGFDATSLEIHLQTLLSQPFLFMAMVLLAACVSLRPPRLGGTAIFIMAGVLIGFAVFFSASFLQALGASQQIPIFVAAWFPSMICFLLGLGWLMNQEDG